MIKDFVTFLVEYPAVPGTFGLLVLTSLMYLTAE